MKVRFGLDGFEVRFSSFFFISFYSQTLIHVSVAVFGKFWKVVGLLSFLIVGLMTHRAYMAPASTAYGVAYVRPNTIGLLETLQSRGLLPLTMFHRRFVSFVARTSISL